MTPTHFSSAGLPRKLRRWLPILVFPTILVVGCGDGDNGPIPVATSTPTSSPTRSLTVTPVRTATPTRTPTTGGDVAAACQKLSSCDQCFINERGVCLSADACAARVSSDVAGCINAVNGCSPSALGDCLPVGCDATDSDGECE